MDAYVAMSATLFEQSLVKMQLDVTPLKTNGKYCSTETSKTVQSLY